MAKTGRIKTMDDAPWQAKCICRRGIKVGNRDKMLWQNREGTPTKEAPTLSNDSVNQMMGFLDSLVYPTQY
jgi:hypothetical protein